LDAGRRDEVREDVATKFFEHFLYIAAAMNNLGDEGLSLWNEEDDFFYDVLHTGGGQHAALKIHSIVGLVPLFAVTTMEPGLLAELPDFKGRVEWFLANRPDLAKLVSRWQEEGSGERRLLAILRGHRMKGVLRRMLDEGEYLSPYGVRALSRHHAEHPFVYETNGARYTVGYEPAESSSGLFGGNSNWRGPIWFPVNYLIIESLQVFHYYYGDDFKVECPTGSGQFLTLRQVADELSRRLIRIFARDGEGRRAVFGGTDLFQRDPHWRDYLVFSEYFHGDNGAGIGASHQTGWTGLVAKLIQQQGEQTAAEAACGRPTSA
jgi:Glycosyl hydrolase family 63 C-terminal domain